MTLGTVAEAVRRLESVAPSILSAAPPPPPLLTFTVTIDDVDVLPAASLARACNV
jgi:hypothetical protein